MVADEQAYSLTYLLLLLVATQSEIKPECFPCHLAPYRSMVRCFNLSHYLPGGGNLAYIMKLGSHIKDISLPVRQCLIFRDRLQSFQNHLCMHENIPLVVIMRGLSSGFKALLEAIEHCILYMLHFRH